MQETSVQSLDWDDPLEKEMVTHFSTLAWRILRTEEPGGLQTMGSQSRTTERLTLTKSRMKTWPSSKSWGREGGEGR